MKHILFVVIFLVLGSVYITSAHSALEVGDQPLRRSEQALLGPGVIWIILKEDALREDCIAQIKTKNIFSRMFQYLLCIEAFEISVGNDGLEPPLLPEYVHPESK